MSAPTWTICIPTIPRRAALFARLMERLLPQFDAYGGAVQVVAWLNEGTPRLAEIRDAMVHWASFGAPPDSYISFIDDDDMVPPYFVDEVMAALWQRPDHVGFQVDYWKDGRYQGIKDHSLRHRRWGARVRRETDPPGGKLVLFRDFTHIDPIRTELARCGRFAAAAPHVAEDRVWCRQVRPHLRTEVYIARPMYHYYWVPSLSAWDEPGKARLGSGAGMQLLSAVLRDKIDSPYFTWHPESL